MKRKRSWLHMSIIVGSVLVVCFAASVVHRCGERIAMIEEN